MNYKKAHELVCEKLLGKYSIWGCSIEGHDLCLFVEKPRLNGIIAKRVRDLIGDTNFHIDNGPQVRAEYL